MYSYGADIYTEAVGDPDTLANLGPLRPMAGIWEGTKGADEHPVLEGVELDIAPAQDLRIGGGRLIGLGERDVAGRFLAPRRRREQKCRRRR